MRLRVLGVVATAVVCAFLTACGSGNSSPTVTTVAVEDRPPPKAQFIEEVDAVCAKRNPEVQALGDRASESADTAESSSDLDDVADIYREAISIVGMGEEELRALTPPPSDAEIYNSYLRSFSRQAALVEALADALDAGDIERMETVADELETIDATSDGIAKGYGFQVCGTD